MASETMLSTTFAGGEMGMRRLVSASVSASVLALGLVLGSVSVAEAQQPSNSWSTNSPVGYCNQRSGGFAVAAQNFLWTSDAYRYVDNSWGPNSNTALRAFQGRFGLAVDGCAGPATWGQMRGLVVSTCSPGYVCNAPNYRVTYVVNGQIARQSWYTRTNCDWGSYIPSGLNASPIVGGRTYGFSSSLTGVVSCA